MKAFPIPMEVTMAADKLPALHYATLGAPALTLYAAYDILLFPFEPLRVTSGIALALPDDIGALVLPEPSMAELGVVPFADMFGADDRKPLSVLLMLHRRADGRGPGVMINRGDPIARLATMPIVRVRTVQVKQLLSGPGAPPPSARDAAD
jgi:dUTPase